MSWLQYYYDKNDVGLIETKNYFDEVVAVYKKIFDILFNYAYIDQFVANILK